MHDGHLKRTLRCDRLTDERLLGYGDRILRALATPHRLGSHGGGSRRGRGCRLLAAVGLAGVVVPLALEHEVEYGLVVGALAAESRRPCRLWLAGDAGVLRVGLREHDLRPLTLRRIGEEQAARLQPPLVVAELADVENVARPQREPVEDSAVPRVRVIAADADVDLADAIPLPLGDVVDEVELTRLLKKPWIGANVSEHETPSAVDVADEVQVGVHLRLVEVLAPFELEVSLEELVHELGVAVEGDVADGVARPLADHKREVRPVPIALVDHFHLAAHLGLEEAEAPVVGGERFDVLLDNLAVDVAAEKPEHARLRLDLGE